MRITVCILVFTILYGCNIEKEASNLKVDHINIWVNNPIEGKRKLEEIGFTAIPDSLCQIHRGQGTTGRYFYFLNTYLELIFINNKEEFKKNAQKNNQLDFIERSNSPENGFSPFSIALKMENYNKEKIPFNIVEYAQDWMGENKKIYVAKNSKIKKEEPSIFVVYPEIEFDIFEDKNDLVKIPEEYSNWREFYHHKNGVEKITMIKIYSNDLDEKSETIKTLKQIENVELLEGKEYLMEIYFDNHIQNKFFDLRPELPLKVYL